MTLERGRRGKGRKGKTERGEREEAERTNSSDPGVSCIIPRHTASSPGSASVDKRNP